MSEISAMAATYVPLNLRSAQPRDRDRTHDHSTVEGLSENILNVYKIARLILEVQKMGGKI